MVLQRHRLAELRSLYLHQQVTRRIAEDETFVPGALGRLRRAEAEGTTHPDDAQAWRARLLGPREALLEALTADTEAARALRQSRPFSFVVEARRRNELWHAAARTWAQGHAPR